MELSDHQASKMESFQQHDDSINAIRKLAINKKDTLNDGNKEMKCFRCGKSGHLANNKICKVRSATCNSCQKVSHFASGCQFKNKINSVDETKSEGIYCIDPSASESDSKFANNITPKSEEKKLSKVICKINSVDIILLVNSGVSVNIINTETLQKFSKVCEFGLETTNSKIYTFGSNNPLKLKGKFNANIKNNGFEVCTWFYVIDKLKGCVCYIFASLLLGLNKSTCQIKNSVFYFTSKPLFILMKIKF